MKLQIWATIHAGYHPETQNLQTARALVPIDADEYYTNTSGRIIFDCVTQSGDHVAATREEMKEIEPVFLFDDFDRSPAASLTAGALAEKAINKYRLDASRVLSAINILATPHTITPKFGYLEIKSISTNESYAVTEKSCPCKDSTLNNAICKHRIAAWMYNQQHQQSNSIRYFKHTYCFECDSVHWIEETQNNGETCHGEKFDPFKIPNSHTSGRGLAGKGIKVIYHEYV